MKQENITMEQYFSDIAALAKNIREKNREYKKLRYTGVYGIPRGGYLPAIHLGKLLNLPVVTEIGEGTLIVDDIVDSGSTLAAYKENDKAVVYAREYSKDKVQYYGAIRDGWLHFPDEKDSGIEEHIRRILEYIGENPNREGLIGTPDRVKRMFHEIFRGYDPTQKPKITTFDNGKDGIVYDNMVVDSGDFVSKCEHHMVFFWGKYWFAYIPNPKGKILGLSKIARVVDYCSARLQLQERLVHDIVDMLKEALGEENPPLGIALIMKAHHGCKEFRGVKKKGVMTASYIDGCFRDDAIVREEFMRQVGELE